MLSSLHLAETSSFDKSSKFTAIAFGSISRVFMLQFFPSALFARFGFIPTRHHSGAGLLARASLRFSLSCFSAETA
jgi:hypothetical protein